jgi:hypothetical protein
MNIVKTMFTVVALKGAAHRPPYAGAALAIMRRRTKPQVGRKKQKIGPR